MRPTRANRARGGSGFRLATAGLAIGLVLSACSGPSGTDGAAAPSGREGEPTASSPLPGSGAGDGSCSPAGGEPLPEPGPSVQTIVLQEGDAGTPRVEAVVYPHPDYEGRPWSQWGQGIVLADGRFVSAIGDHLGADGNTYLYEFSPDSSTLSLIGDVLTFTDHEPGGWGYGKVHGQMVPGPCGEVYFSTYWGSSTGLRYDATYRGDVIFRLDLDARTIQNLGVPVEHRGLPSFTGQPNGLLYGEAVDPATDAGEFFAYDVGAGRVVFLDEARTDVGFRNVAVDANGRAYYSEGGGRLAVYDPATGSVSEHRATMPGRWLRASTRPAPDGTVYGVTREPDALFALEPSGEIRTLGPVRGYTTSVALSPRGDEVLYVPGAHGDSYQQGTPLIAVDVETGEERVIVELNELSERALGLRLGGTYDVAVDPERRLAYIGFNAGSSGESFGEVVLVVVHLP